MNKRLQTIQQHLKKNKLDALLITNAYEITYITEFSNFSHEEREAFLFITKEESYIITDGRYSEAVREAMPTIILYERSSEKSLSEIFTEITYLKKISNVGFNDQDITFAEYNFFKKIFKSLHPLSISAVRKIKTTQEIAAIKKACAIGDEAFTYITTKLHINISEKELALELEYFIKKHGADLSFPSIVAFGPNSSIPHHQTGATSLKKNNFVLFDFGVGYNNYCSDMTRTVFFGMADEIQKKMHTIVLEAQQKAVQYISDCLARKKEIIAKDVDKIARNHIIANNFPTIPHSLGHGIGVEVHEAPRLSPTSTEMLTEGMVFSIEPGIYLPDYGGIRIEDLFAIQNNQLFELTTSNKSFFIN